MSKKPTAKKEQPNGNKAEAVSKQTQVDLEDEDLGFLDEGEDNETESSEDSDGGDSGFDEEEEAPQVKSSEPANRGPRPERHQLEAPKKRPAARAQAPLSKDFLTGLKDQVEAAQGVLRDESNAKLVKAHDHLQQAATWLNDYIGSLK